MSKRYNSTELNQLLNDLYALQRLGIKVGLDHTQKLLEVCKNPQNNFASIHIAGTNGKGSTAAMLASILRQSGYKVGLYTSPHLIRFNERVRINGIPISNEKIVEFISNYKTAISDIESTFFEATTALAFKYFSDENVDIAVVETGLGGRLDSTNVLSPMVTIITSISSDHTEILGTDIKTIALEKGGIIKEGVPLILSKQNKTVKRVLQNIADEKNVTVCYCKNDVLDDVNIDKSGTSFKWKGVAYKTSLIGEHQARNAVLAIEASKINNGELEYGIISSGLLNTIWPARLQKIRNELPIFYDVAHNPQGIQIMLESLSIMYSEKPIGILVLKADKEIDNIIPILKNRFRKLIVTSQPETGLMDAQSLANSLTKHRIKSQLEPDIAKAIKIVNNNVSSIIPGVIFGSHYIGETVFNEYGFSFDNGII